jgi:hypothetical protein
MICGIHFFDLFKPNATKLLSRKKSLWTVPNLLASDEVKVAAFIAGQNRYACYPRDERQSE